MSQKRWTITFSPAGDGEYQVAVRRPGAVHRFTTPLPPDISDLWTNEEKSEGGTQRSFRSSNVASISPEQRFFQAADLPTLKEIGARVLETVFDLQNGDEGRKLVGALEDRIADNDGVEIEFDLSQTAELSAIPWESLYLPSHDRFLAIGTTSNLVRRLDAQSDLPDPISRPIRILVAAANPRDDLDTDVELGNIQRRIDELVTEGSGTFEVQSLPAATRDQFRRKVLEWKPHIIHYIGHSAFSDGKGYLYFESEKEGESDKVSAETLRNMLLNQRPWLVVLNSCQSGQTSKDAPMAGVAQNLLQRLNIPFVVAMQQPVSDDAAINFSQDFYTTLTSGKSIADAVSNGRCAIANDAHPLTQLELITPALYTSGDTDRIAFEDAPVAAAVPLTSDKEETKSDETKKGFLGIFDEKTTQIASIVTSLTVIGGAAFGAFSYFNGFSDGDASTSDTTSSSAQVSADGGVVEPNGTAAVAGPGASGQRSQGFSDAAGRSNFSTGSVGAITQAGGAGANQQFVSTRLLVLPLTYEERKRLGFPEATATVIFDGVQYPVIDDNAIIEGNLVPLERLRLTIESRNSPQPMGPAPPAPYISQPAEAFTWPAVGQTIAIEGRDYPVTDDGVLMDGVIVPFENVEILLGVRDAEPAGSGADYMEARGLLIERPGAPSPTIELGFEDGALPEPLGSTNYWEYQMPRVPAQNAGDYRPARFCDGLINRVYFDTNARMLNAKEQARLQAMVPAMGCPGSALVVSGFTDTTGEEDYNAELGLDRATHVVEELFASEEAYVVLADASTYGEQFNTNALGDGVEDAANRRAQIYLDFRCGTTSDAVVTLSDQTMPLPDTIVAPYAGEDENGDFSPILLALHVRDVGKADYFEMALSLDNYVRHMTQEWELPPGAIFPMIVDDSCLGDDEKTRLEISYETAAQ